MATPRSKVFEPSENDRLAYAVLVARHPEAVRKATVQAEMSRMRSVAPMRLITRCCAPRGGGIGPPHGRPPVATCCRSDDDGV
jgi:hypothetical protein